MKVTLADMGWLRICSVSAFDFASGEVTQTMVVKRWRRRDGADHRRRRSDVRFDIADPLFGSPGAGALAISRRPDMPYLSLAMPFPGDPVGLFYEQKVPGMAATGSVVLGDKTFTFDSAAAVMD